MVVFAECTWALEIGFSLFGFEKLEPSNGLRSEIARGGLSSLELVVVEDALGL